MSRSTNETAVRVRFAPSPTGYLHVGGIRSALFNWLWARHNGGVFVLRMEDTDRARLVAGAADQINDSLEALGIAPDEGPRQGGEYGPYVQSERLELYREHAERLVATGALYRCWCSPERLAGLREAAVAAGRAFKYDRHCLATGNQRGADEPHVLRFRIPETPATIGWDDAVRGHLAFAASELDDFVAVKTDGFPTYQFANVIDDHLMAISHVLRADEWLPSTPKHLLLFAALGWEAPVYAHLPAVQGPDGHKKLSKRDGAQSVQEYVDGGYLPEALRSFLASLGWNDGTTQEVYTTPELVERFTLERVARSPAQFDRDRLTWMNGALIRQMPPGELLERCDAGGFWPAAAAGSRSAYRRAVLGLVQERLKFLAELPELTEFFFTPPEPAKMPGLLTKHYSMTEAREVLTEAIQRLRDEAESWTEPNLEHQLRGLAETEGLHTSHFFGLLRVALTGRTAAPGLFETMQVLGAHETLLRLNTARAVAAGV